MSTHNMDFSEPEEATQLKDELSTFIEDEIEPLEEEHARFSVLTRNDISSMIRSSRFPSISS